MICDVCKKTYHIADGLYLCSKCEKKREVSLS